MGLDHVVPCTSKKRKRQRTKKKKQQQLGFYPKSVWEPPGSLKLGCDMIPLIVLKEHQLLSGGEWMGTEAKVEAFYSFSWRLVERWLWLNLGGWRHCLPICVHASLLSCLTFPPLCFWRGKRAFPYNRRFMGGLACKSSLSKSYLIISIALWGRQELRILSPFDREVKRRVMRC